MKKIKKSLLYLKQIKRETSHGCIILCIERKHHLERIIMVTLVKEMTNRNMMIPIPKEVAITVHKM